MMAWSRDLLVARGTQEHETCRHQIANKILDYCK